MFKNAKILVIGDVMLDHYVYGVVERDSPEAPVPVLTVQKDDLFVGGAGVVASTLQNLGVQVSFLSVVGDDGAAKQVRSLLLQNLSECSLALVTEAGRKTTVKKRFVATRPAFRMLLRADEETISDISRDTEQAVLQQLAVFPKPDFIIISDYHKGMLTKNLIAKLLSFAKSNGSKVIVDSKKNIARYAGAYVAVPNVHELCLAFGLETKNDDRSVSELGVKLSSMLGSAVVVKRSSKGASIVGNCLNDGSSGKSDNFRTFPSSAQNVVNVSGAGDIFIAIMTAALASGKTLDDAVMLANYGCAKAITKQHPSITSKELDVGWTVSGNPKGNKTQS